MTKSNTLSFSTLLLLGLSFLSGCYDQVATQTGFGISNEAPPCESVPYASLHFPSNVLVINTENGSFGRMQILRIGKNSENIPGVKYSYSAKRISVDELFYFDDNKNVLNPEVHWASTDGNIVFCKKSLGQTLAFVRSTGGLWGDGWGVIKISNGGLFSSADRASIQLGWPSHSAAAFAHSNPNLIASGLDDYDKYPKGQVKYKNAGAALSLISKLSFKTERNYTKDAKFVKSCAEMKARMDAIGFYAPYGEHLDCQKHPW